MNRSKHFLVSSLVLWAVLVAVPAWRHVRQEHLNQSLVEAVDNADTERVRYLLGRGANPRASTCRPIAFWDTNNWDQKCPDVKYPVLNAAASSGYTDIVRLLIEAGADIQGTGILSDCEEVETPLKLAREYGHPVTVKLLIEKGAKE